jgi:heme/copper-type cytochrome/quinol oxidase subunit 3
MQKPAATLRSATGTPTGRLGVWWVIASEIVIFGGLIMSYLMHRFGHPEWAYQAAHTNAHFGAFNTLVLLTSSLCAVLAHKAAEEGDGPKAARLLLYTALGGFLFIAVKSVEWSIEINHGYTIGSSGFWAFYYCAAGLHGFHVIAGAVIILIIGNKAKQGNSGTLEERTRKGELQRVEYIGIYWHFVDVIWIFLFPLLYIAK